MAELDLGRVVGPAGPTGKSAYSYAVEGGFPGTEAEFTEKLAKYPTASQVLLQDGTSVEAAFQQTVESVTVPSKTVTLTAAELPGYIAALPRLLTANLSVFVSGDVAQAVDITGFYGSGSLWILSSASDPYQTDAAVIHKLKILNSSIRVRLSRIRFEDSGLDHGDALLEVEHGRCEIYECSFIGKRAQTGKNQFAIRSYRNSIVTSSDIYEISGFYMAGISGYSSILSIHSGLGEPVFQGNAYGVHAYRGGAVYLSGKTPDRVGGERNQYDGGIITGESGILIPGMTSRNLLDNWCFLDPINQRGKLEYEVPYSTSLTYTIDRWYLARGTNKYNVDTHTVTLGPEAYAQFSQRIESLSGLEGRQVTVSALCRASRSGVNLLAHGFGGGNHTAPIPVSDQLGLITLTVTIADGWSGPSVSLHQSAVQDTSVDIEIVAMKLELGNYQTLAHQDVSGEWVLNDPPPNKALELAKCQRYQIQLVRPSNATGKNAYGIAGIGLARSTTICEIVVPVPVALNLSHAFVPVCTGNWRLWDGTTSKFDEGIEVTAMVIQYSCQNAVRLYVTASELVAGKTYLLVHCPTGDDTVVNSLLLDGNL